MNGKQVAILFTALVIVLALYDALLHHLSAQDGSPPPPAATTERKNP
ncbi:hypothetical protein [Azospira sp. I09]|nr:hypothetical protein [Azospira sp. I09]